MSLSTHGQQSINRETVDQLALHGKHLRAIAKTHGHRAFLWFECSHNDDALAIRQWFDGLSIKQRLWLPEQTNTDRTDQIQKLLGTESHLVIYDATHGVDPRLLAASSGTLTAGGLYLLLSPPTHQWADTYDREYGVKSSVFLHRLAQHLQTNCVRTPIANLWQIEPPAQQAYSSTPSSTPLSTPLLPARLAEQNNILEQLLNDIDAQVPRVLVIQADRGRGKSTLLARTLLSNRIPQNVAVTALHQSATTVLQQYCEQHNHKAHYLPLQQALRQSHDLLLVDEAATIPLDQLLTLARQSKQIVFATTVDGYEGAGRGFATRFAKQLDQRFIGWHLYQPMQPIRWQAGDGLEALLNRALLLKSDLPPTPSMPISLDDIHCKLLRPSQLIHDAPLLEHIFAILARAHYQTTAMDLRHMLDSPGMSVWVACINDIPCAAALVCTEGGIDDDLYLDIAHKQRRLKHQLLPQLLTQFTLADNLLSQRYQRIVRIAVTPRLQAMGIGSALVRKIIDHGCVCGGGKVDAIGTSFGADDASLGFWLKQGLTPVHLGFKRNPRSGLPAVCMMLAHSVTTDAAIQQAHAQLRLNLQLLKQAQTQQRAADHINPYMQLIDSILSHAPDNKDVTQLHTTFTIQNQLFAASARNFIDSLAAINSIIQLNQPANHKAITLFDALTRNIIASTNKPARLQTQELALEIKSLLQ